MFRARRSPSWRARSPTSATSTSSCRRATDFMPFFLHPRADDAHDRGVPAALRRGRRRAVLPAAAVRWSGPDETSGRPPSATGSGDRDRRRAGVPADELRVQRPARARARARRRSGGRWRSCCRSSSARASRSTSRPTPTTSARTTSSPSTWSAASTSPAVNYLYCAPHTFHLGGDDSRDPEHAGRQGDPRPHRGLVRPQGRRRACATSSTRPARPARIHQHLDIGQGEVDWDAFFGPSASWTSTAS